MGFLADLIGTGQGTGPVAAALSEQPVAVAEPTTDSTLIDRAVSTYRAERVALDIALSIPAVRKAQHVIAGTIATFAIAGYKDGQRLPAGDPRVSWLAQPDPTTTRYWTIARTIQDLIWRDRAVWRITDRTLMGSLASAERLHPNRIDVVTHPLDPDRVTKWIIDGQETPTSQLVIFDGAGLGGLARYGFELLTLYGQLQAAAGRYAVAPHPHAVLKNHGDDLTDDEIDALLASWEAARGRRAIGYLNEVIDYEVIDGYSARELQLTEAREHAALEVARLLALPAFAIDAQPPGSSMTYGNIVDRRRDLVEALRPWMTVVEQTLSLDDRRGQPRGLYLPRGVTAGFLVDAYTRDDPKTRMETWKAGLDAGVLELDEVRAAEPLATGAPTA